jgi:small subunit ribosomal protein S21
MLLVEISAKQPIERALKVLKKKWDKSKAMKILKDKKEFKKKSVRRRDELKRAAYIQKKYHSND